MLSSVYKIVNMAMNILPFGLLIWGYYTMSWGITQAEESWTFHTFVQEHTCSGPAQTFIQTCQSHEWFDWDWNIQVVNLKEAQETYNKVQVFVVAFFSVINVIWIAIYVKNGGALSQPWGTVGYHALNVKAQRQSTYKYFGYGIGFVLAVLAMVGLHFILGRGTDGDSGKSETELEAEKIQAGKILSLFGNGLFQCVLGLFALMTPVPDTVKYGEKLMSRKLKSQPWNTSRQVMEQFQDAVAAARGGDNGYLKEMTGCSDNEVDMLLSDVTAIPFEVSFVTKMTNMLLCKGGDADKHDMGGAASSPGSLNL